MIIKEISINYHCRNCGKDIQVSDLNREMTFNKIIHTIGMTQCVNCKRLGVVDATHIKCELSKKTLATFKYTVRCDMCQTTWSDTFILGGKRKLIEIRTYIKEDLECANSTCPSKSFSLLECKRIN